MANRKVCVNEILLRRKDMIIVNVPEDEKKKDDTARYILSLQSNLASLGYTFSKELMEKLLCLEKDEAISFGKDLLSKLIVLKGADKEYNPMYPNFPEQVMEADEAELFLNAIIHYWTFGQVLPEYEKDARFPLVKNNRMTEIRPGTEDDLLEIFRNILSGNTSISEQDKRDITAIMNDPSMGRYEEFIPEVIPQKENCALVCGIFLENGLSHLIRPYMKTATDVLRFITAISGGDLSLTEKTIYRKMSRAERRLIMSLLSTCVNLVEDMFRYQGQWIRIGEIIHPSEFKNPVYNKVREAFDLLRSNKKPLMFAGKVEESIKQGKMEDAAELLSKRPGEFARRLDKMLRDAEDKDEIIKTFDSIAEKVSAPVLLQVRQHFIERASEEKNDLRVFFPKGKIAMAAGVDNSLPEIRDFYCRKVVDICRKALVRKFSEKEFLGKVYVSEELKDYIVPFSQRSAAASGKVLTRGSRIPMDPEANVIRSFIWWTNEPSADYPEGRRVDLDLSASVYDDNWNLISHVSYTNLRDHTNRVFHSGDIVDGGSSNGKGAAEFIDFDVDRISKNGRYVAIQVYSFSEIPFSDMANCRFGWMEREEALSGENFEPSTVQNVITPSAKSIVFIPAIFDCRERKMIWCDMSVSLDHTGRYFGNNLEGNTKNVNFVCYAMTNISKPNMYDLAKMHAEARGIPVDKREDADIIFDVSAGTEDEGKTVITPYDIDYYMGMIS